MLYYEYFKALLQQVIKTVLFVYLSLTIVASLVVRFKLFPKFDHLQIQKTKEIWLRR